MEQAADLQDWELLSSHSTDDPKGFESLDSDGDSHGAAIKLDYFALDSEKRSIQRVSSEEESEEGGVDSDNPSWVDPDSDPRDLEGSSGEGEFRGSVFPVKNSGGFWSDGSSDCRSSPADSEKGKVGNSGDSVMRVSVEGIETGYQDSGDDERENGLDFGGSGESEGIETGQKEHGVEESGELVKMGDGSGSGGSGDFVMRVGVEGMETGHQDSSDDETEKRLDFGGSGEREGIETGQEEHGVEESGELVKTGDGSGSLESVSKNEGEKRVAVWWKMPQDLIKFYVFKMRPVWAVPIAAAIMGFVVLGRKWYKMKHKKQSIQLKFAYDDKKASQLKDRAARLNEAFTVAKRVPVVRTFPASGVSAWPIVPLR